MNIRKLGMEFNFPVKDTDSRQHGKGKSVFCTTEWLKLASVKFAFLKDVPGLLWIAWSSHLRIRKVTIRGNSHQQ